MPATKWLRLTAACALGRVSQNVLYRRAALGHVRSRRGEDGKLLFCVEDLVRIRDAGPTPAPTPATTEAV